MNNSAKLDSWLEQPLLPLISKIRLEHCLFFLIIVVTLLSRLVNLDLRVMSHDEINHVVPSYDLYIGRGYRHDPITHGPLQFHLIALSYFLFGDNDFSSRLPAALFSTMAVAFIIIYFRRYLGKIGSLLAGVFFMISPFMLFYGRYARNEAFITLFGAMMIYATLRYLECGKSKWLYLLTLSLILHFITKETAYIYAAQLLLFLFILTLFQLVRYPWKSPDQRNSFFLYTSLIVVIFTISVIVSVFITRSTLTHLQATNPLSQITNNLGEALTQLLSYLQLFGINLIPTAIPLIIGGILILWLSGRAGWNQITDFRYFDLVVVIGTLVLPLLSAIPSKMTGVDPSDYTNQWGIYITAIYLLYFFIVAIILGVAWRRSLWWKVDILFYSIFIIFYTTFFTNGFGFFTGIVGALSHWMAQHGLQRGDQPLYYYALIQIPTYEFLLAGGTFFAFYYAIKKKLFWQGHPSSTTNQIDNTKPLLPVPVMALFLYWSFSSLLAYSIAGEKMPWLTVHIIIPMIFCAAWAIGQLTKELLNYRNKKRNIVVFLLGTLFLLSLFRVLIILLGDHAPFQGKTQVQLAETNVFLLSIIMTGVIGYLLYYQTHRWRKRRIRQVILLSFISILVIITFRTSYRAAFINYDFPTEFLVYAHAAPGPKQILTQVEEISRRTTQGLGIKVAYDNHSLYPFWWYFRNYPNKIAYMENPTRTLEDAPIILAGQANYNKLDSIVRNNYYVFEYMRLWWPMMDYYNLNWSRISNAIFNPQMRQAIFNIWFNRDYSLYAQLTDNQSLTLENWSPAERMRMYLRKDIASQLWEFGSGTGMLKLEESDPYLSNIQDVLPNQMISGSGTSPGLLIAPRGIALAEDGSIYIADSLNHRIQHFSADGNLIKSWGEYANILEGEAPGGTFNEPWDLAIASDGSIYVADTWNHRIQKFTSDGEFIRMWGDYAMSDAPTSLYGPRGITIDNQNRIYVTDTGNKRVVIYDENGNYIAQFGGAGIELGKMDEPVGIALDENKQVYIADTWNRRIQVFSPDQSGTIYTPINSWDVDGWYGQSINNKPYLTISPSGVVLATDPEASRILEFSQSGDFLRGWSGFSLSEDLPSQPCDLQFDAFGYLWVSDSATNMLMKFTQLQ